MKISFETNQGLFTNISLSCSVIIDLFLTKCIYLILWINSVSLLYDNIVYLWVLYFYLCAYTYTFVGDCPVVFLVVAMLQIYVTLCQLCFEQLGGIFNIKRQKINTNL